MKFELKTFHRNIPDEELLDDLKRLAKVLQKNSFTTREYDSNGGKYGSNTIYRRFKGWNNSLRKAGLENSIQQNISKEELFKNLENIWISLGRQPTYRDVAHPISLFSASTYENRFQTWNKALETFAEYINSDVEEEQPKEINETTSLYREEVVYKHTTKRIPSERLKVQVLMRDGNRCRLCGVTVTGDNIHFDHIKPWSKNGETTLENLQVLCSKHNLAKGDLEYPIH